MPIDSCSLKLFVATAFEEKRSENFQEAQKTESLKKVIKWKKFSKNFFQDQTNV